MDQVDAFAKDKTHGFSHKLPVCCTVDAGISPITQARYIFLLSGDEAFRKVIIAGNCRENVKM
jgi:hypothetical protein